jgi:hypothetical protein
MCRAYTHAPHRFKKAVVVLYDVWRFKTRQNLSLLDAFFLLSAAHALEVDLLERIQLPVQAHATLGMGQQAVLERLAAQMRSRQHNTLQSKDDLTYLPFEQLCIQIHNFQSLSWTEAQSQPT